MIDIDGTQGEGGGQVLRTALTLSILTSQPFHMVGVRSKRPRPGILAQPLAAIRAAARLCGAQVVGAAIELPRSVGPGNTLTLVVRHERVMEVLTAFGQRGVPAEAVAEQACRAVREYLLAPVAVGLHLADQLLLPLAIAGAGRFTTLPPVSRHFESNAAVISEFMTVQTLPVIPGSAARGYPNLQPDGKKR